jgi:hypothetical protein
VLGASVYRPTRAVFKSPELNARACTACAMESRFESAIVSSFSQGHQLRNISLQLIAVMGDLRDGGEVGLGPRHVERAFPSMRE